MIGVLRAEIDSPDKAQKLALEFKREQHYRPAACACYGIVPYGIALLDDLPVAVVLDHYAVGDHNCLSIPFDKLLKEGFNTRQCDVRPASSINTAMQLVAVIFQLQSLQQFGGVAATHLDVSMVPYVRKSFLKHFKDGLKYIEGMSDEDIKKFEEELKSFEM